MLLDRRIRPALSARMKLFFPALLSAFLVLAAPARAHDERPACMAPIAISSELVIEAARFGWRGGEARGAAPAFLIGELYYLRDNQELAGGVHGSVVFVRGAGGVWRAFFPMPDEALVGAYVATSTGAVMLATQVQTEGPGQSWTFVSLSSAMAAGECHEIAFPDALNQPAWANENLELHDFDVSTDGRGEIIAVARVERQAAEQSWVFRYRTRDAGATWAKPSRLARLRDARGGLFEPADGQTPPALVAELERFAAAPLPPH